MSLRSNMHATLSLALSFLVLTAGAIAQEPIELPEELEPLRAEIRQSNDIYRVRDLGRKLLKSGNRAAGKAVAQLLSDDELGRRRYGLALSYGFAKNKKALPVLEPLLRDEDAQLRAHVAVALEDIAEKKAVKMLLRAIDREEDEFVRKNLVRALGRCGAKSAEASKALMKLARGGKSKLVQRNALIALSSFRKDRKVEKLLIRVAFLSGDRPGGTGSQGGGRTRRSDNRVDWEARYERMNAAALSLGLMRSSEGRKQAEKRIKYERRAEFVEVLRSVLALMDGRLKPKSPEALALRRDFADDRIRRDGEPPFKKS